MLERQGLLVLQVRGEKEALQEREVKSDPTDCRDLKVVQVDQDQMGQRVTLVQKGVSENQEVQDFRGCQGIEVSQDPQAQREMLALLETKDLRAKQELTVHGVFLDLLDLLVPVDPMARRVKPDHQDLQVAEGQEE